MKAVIMAGGVGSRLLPITEKRPKPLVPINRISAIRRILKSLYTAGIREAAVTVGYLAERIIAELGDECEGIRLRYFKEDRPLGTAGGVAAAAELIGDDDFIVISGDAVSEIDLARAIRKRAELDAELVIVLSRAEDPGEYGVVMCDGDGRITAFCEKPSLSGTFSDRVNTGIYVFSSSVLELIPKDEPSDFGKDIFPKMLSLSRKMYGYEDGGYWCDVGDPMSYLSANMHYSGGKSCIGDGCNIESEEISGSVILEGCKVGKGSRISSSVICEGSSIGNGCSIEEGCVIGPGCNIGDGCTIKKGSRLGGGSKLPSGTTFYSHAFSKSALPSLFIGGGMRISADEAHTSFAIKLGEALGKLGEGKKIGIMHDGSLPSLRYASALVRGLRRTDTEVVMLGEGFASACACSAFIMGLEISVFTGFDGKEISVSFYDSLGLYPERDFERRLCSLMSSEEETEGSGGGKISEENACDNAYFPLLVKNRVELDLLPIKLAAENAPSGLLKRALIKKGASIEDGGLCLKVSNDGLDLVASQDGFSTDFWHIKALLLKYLIRDKVALPVCSPSSLFDLCRGGGEKYSHCPSTDPEKEARSLSIRFPELIHAPIAAMELAGLISASGKTLGQLCATLPAFCFRQDEYQTSARGRLGILSSLGAPDRDGVVSEYSRGRVRIVPTRSGFSLFCEAASSEYASELLSMSKKEIERLIRKN